MRAIAVPMCPQSLNGGMSLFRAPLAPGGYHPLPLSRLREDPEARRAHATDDTSRAVLGVSCGPEPHAGGDPQHLSCGLQRRRICALNVIGHDGD